MAVSVEFGAIKVYAEGTVTYPPGMTLEEVDALVKAADEAQEGDA